ncbi:MAG TPA: winged helix-turn-helix domain-containing protein [Candidatus Nitrosotalea sp.]|nr:winged helix-turn-helix domain-containing protein [Candidatus Nitrosotalea sp.]
MRTQSNTSPYHATKDVAQKGNELPYAKNLMWMVFVGSRGGQNRIKMALSLKKSPLNAHQLSKEIGLNYRAIQHHITVLEKNNLVSHVGQKYGTTYFLSTFLEVNMASFDEIVAGLYRGK